jgi:poly(3-hydroxybutyrate) depolymerase
MDAGGSATPDSADTGAPTGGAARPSAGCGKANPFAGSRMFMTQGLSQPIIVSVPPAYDPMKPYPLAFGFHGAGLRETDCRGGNCAGLQRVFGEKGLVVFMKSIGSNWEGGANRDRNAMFFSEVLAHMKAEYCVDESRVVVAGSSSGATFSNILGCRFGDQLRVVAPVAGSAPEKTNCKGTPPAIVIHGVSDSFATGEGVRDWYAMRNGCTMATEPDLAMEVAKVRSARMSRQEIHACSSYTTCANGAVRFCAHSVGGYDGSTHGWPPIGGQLIWDFLQGLP